MNWIGIEDVQPPNPSIVSIDSNCSINLRFLAWVIAEDDFSVWVVNSRTNVATHGDCVLLCAHVSSQRPTNGNDPVCDDTSASTRHCVRQRERISFVTNCAGTRATVGSYHVIEVKRRRWRNKDDSSIDTRYSAAFCGFAYLTMTWAKLNFGHARSLVRSEAPTHRSRTRVLRWC